MYEEPPGEGGKKGGRGRAESAVQVNYYPQHGENTSDDGDATATATRGKTSAPLARRFHLAIYLLKQDAANPDLMLSQN